VQPKHLALLSRDDEVEKRRVDIRVMDAPPLLGSESEEKVDGLDASHGHECVIVVDPLLLDKAVHDEPRLVLDHLPSFILLELEHPLQSDWVVASRQVNELPRTIVLDRVHLLLHRDAPGRITLGFSEGAGFPGVHQVKLGVDVKLNTPWHHRLVAEDVIDGAVA
jgi:hypothetical protein